jgi:hypothetical protein
MNRNKLRKGVWFSLFCSWAQYFKRENLKSFFSTNLFTAVIWGMAFAFFNNYFFNSSHHDITLPLFIVSLKMLIAILEKHTDPMIPYTMTKTIPVSNYQVFSMRFLARYSSPSVIFVLLALFLNSYVRENSVGRSAIIAILFLILIFELEEIVAYISYNTSGVNIIIILLWVIVFVGFIGAFTISANQDFNLNTLSCSITAVFLAFFICGLFKWNGYHTGKKGKIKKADAVRSLRLSKQTITPGRMLLKKELLFLFRHKPSILISAVFLSCTMFVFSHSASTDLFLMPAFFVFDFALGYGMNYLGIENHDIITVLNSAVYHKIMLRIKIAVFSSVSFIGILLMTIVYSVIFKPSAMEVAKSIAASLCMISIYMFICHYFSTKYYACEKSKKKHSILRVGVGIFVYFIFAVFSALLTEMQIKNITGVFTVSIIVLISVFFTVIRPTFFEKLLQKAKTKTLTDLSNY